jgi:hypothetical protein
VGTVPRLDHVLEPFVLGPCLAAGRVELPERQALRGGRFYVNIERREKRRDCSYDGDLAAADQKLATRKAGQGRVRYRWFGG